MAGRSDSSYRPINRRPTTSFGNPATFTAAANTQASDYDKIMEQYDNLARTSAANPLTAAPINFTPITPQTSQYKQSEDVTRSLANLKDLSNTGGYSAANIQDIRERDISPIRSIYANAQEEMERQKSLSGGYSPNFNAVTAQMSRDEANKIGDITTKANADIAQNVASNRMSSSGAYAGASASANAAQAEADRRNIDIINQINEANENRRTQIGMFNTGTALDAARTNRSDTLNAISGKASLYGTTPALTNTFGNQVVQARQLGQNQRQINDQKYRTFLGGR